MKNKEGVKKMNINYIDILLEAEEAIQQKKIIQWDKITKWFKKQQLSIQEKWRQFKLDMQKRLAKEPEKKTLVQKMVGVVQTGCKTVMDGCNKGISAATGQDFNLAKEAQKIVNNGVNMVTNGIADIVAKFAGGGNQEQQPQDQQQQQPQDQQQQ